MGHVIVVIAAVLFGIAALVSGLAGARQRNARSPVTVGDPPPAAGTPRDRFNKSMTVAAVCALLCVLAIIALSLGR